MKKWKVPYYLIDENQKIISSHSTETLAHDQDEAYWNAVVTLNKEYGDKHYLIAKWEIKEA